MIAPDEILRAAEEHRVGIEGFLTDKRLPATEASKSIRAKTALYTEQIETARVWLRRFVRRRTLNRSATSRTFCVHASQETGVSISNGAFIIACVLEGVMVRQDEPNSPDAFTNLSLKRIT